MSRSYTDHRVQVIVWDGRLIAKVVCPHEEKDWTAVPFSDRPNCRQPYTEDGEPDLNERALLCAAKECSVDFYVGEEMVSGVTEGTVLADARITYCWDDESIEIDHYAGPALLGSIEEAE